MSVGYIDRARDYARRVVEGEEIAGQLEILACQRYIRDLERADSDLDWPYVFSADAAIRPCAFIEGLRHVRGRWAKHRATIELEDWQIFVIINLFGWVRRDTGVRRFTTAYWEVARKNAKSTLGAAIALYMFVGDGEPGAEVFSAATTGQQARIVFEIARGMVRRESAFAAAGVVTQNHGLYLPADERRFEPLNAEGNTLDGLNVHCAIIDELHAHANRKVYDVIDSARGAREQALLLAITTAGFNRDGICYEQRDYVVQVLKGLYVDENYFGIIYTLDEKDDWKDPRNWRKANPNYGISVNPLDFEQALTKSLTNVYAQDVFKTKRLNMWVSTELAWMDSEFWKACGRPGIKPEDYKHLPCYMGLDLAHKIDMSALALLFCDIEKRTYYLIIKYFISETTAARSTNRRYREWIEAGWLITTPGNITDFDLIEEQILKYKAMCEDLRACGYDQNNAVQLATHMNAAGVPMVEIPQNIKYLSEPLKELQALAYSGRLIHDDNPITNWMASNVYVEPDRNKNIFPRKQRPENKIDGISATLNALNRALVDHNIDIDDFINEPIIG